MKISARNQLKGVVRAISEGAVNSQVVIGLRDGLEVVSIITNDSVHRLGLKVGAPAYAVIKASDVMVAVDEA
ncbi:transporter [bacterium CPR1]|nr:transporter [bacterium CPR1]